MSDPLEVLAEGIDFIHDRERYEAMTAALAALRAQVEREEAALMDILGLGRFEYPGHDDMCVEAGSGVIGKCDKDYCPVAIARAALSTEEPSEIPPQNWNTEKDHRKRDWPVKEPSE